MPDRVPLTIYCPLCGEEPRSGLSTVVGVICRDCRKELSQAGYHLSPGNDPLFIVPKAARSPLSVPKLDAFGPGRMARS